MTSQLKKCENPPRYFTRPGEGDEQFLYCDNHPWIEPQNIGNGSEICCLPLTISTPDDILQLLEFGDQLSRKHREITYVTRGGDMKNPKNVEYYSQRQGGLLLKNFLKSDWYLLEIEVDGFIASVYIKDPTTQILTSTFVSNAPTVSEMDILLWNLASDMKDADFSIDKIIEDVENSNLSYDQIFEIAETASIFGRDEIAEELKYLANKKYETEREKGEEEYALINPEY